MATLNVVLNSVCSGGGHIQVTANVNGANARVLDLEVANIYSTVTDDEAIKFMEVYLKIHSIGKTRVQFRNSLTAGLAGTI